MPRSKNPLNKQAQAAAKALAQRAQSECFEWSRKLHDCLITVVRKEALEFLGEDILDKDRLADIILNSFGVLEGDLLRVEERSEGGGEKLAQKYQTYRLNVLVDAVDPEFVEAVENFEHAQK